jgi:hypothetical protein
MSGASLITAAQNVFEGLTPSDERAQAAFDAAFAPFEPDPQLLAGAPARSLSNAIADFVSVITRLDIDRVLKHQGWWSRFTGADLEARLEFEVATHSLSRDMTRLAGAAAQARKACALMRRDMERLASSTQAHEVLADQAMAFLRDASFEDANAARFQRRLANLETMVASNKIVAAQMALAMEHLTVLLDRYGDIEKRLFPVWRHHALAVSQGVSPEAAPKSIEKLHAVRSRLTNYLQGPETISP